MMKKYHYQKPLLTPSQTQSQSKLNMAPISPTKTSRIWQWLAFLACLGSSWSQVYSFDSTAVLPKGVSRAMVNTAHTRFENKTNSDGQSTGFASSLDRNLSFADFSSTLSQYEKLQLDAFMLTQGIDSSSEVGKMTAEFSGHLDVVAPSYAYGVTDRFTIGILVPMIKAETDIAVGFEPNQNAYSFVETLSKRELGLRSKVADAVSALNSVPQRLNQRLSANGYTPLEKWSNSGIGDIMVKGKYLHQQGASFAVASVAGINFATGKKDDPNNLTDIPLGDGSNDLFYGLVLDQPINDRWMLNETITYTAQLTSEARVRMVDDDTSITDQVESVNVDQGDYINADLSAQYDSVAGFQAGAGYLFQHKYKDQYYGAGESTSKLEDDTEKQVHRAQAMIGYSTVKAYKAQTASIPYAGFLMYERHLQSKNTSTGDLLKMEMKVFF